MVRVRLDIAYDGTQFAGWAVQPHQRTVQGCIEAALNLVTAGQAGAITVAGRTDAGVHARGQVAHVDVGDVAWAALPGHSHRPASEALLGKLAGVLPEDIVITRVTEVGADFDARFSACGRAYTYRLADGIELRDPLTRGHVAWYPRHLDEQGMGRASAAFVGEHDFLPFCRPRVGASTIRTVRRLDITRDGAGIITAHIEADAFCHHMVRMFMGALITVGEGRRDEAWPGQVLAAGIHNDSVAVAAARVLVLERVDYPAPHEWAHQAERNRSVRGPVMGAPRPDSFF